MNTLFNSLCAICIYVELWRVSHGRTETSLITLHNESMYPLTGTCLVIDKPYPLTNTDIVNGFSEKLTESKQSIPLHNEEAN
ncbi:hypothetical protein [Shewanella putrefaciens]